MYRTLTTSGRWINTPKLVRRFVPVDGHPIRTNFHVTRLILLGSRNRLDSVQLQTLTNCLSNTVWVRVCCWYFVKVNVSAKSSRSQPGSELFATQCWCDLPPLTAPLPTNLCQHTVVGAKRYRAPHPHFAISIPTRESAPLPGDRRADLLQSLIGHSWSNFRFQPLIFLTPSEQITRVPSTFPLFLLLLVPDSLVFFQLLVFQMNCESLLTALDVSTLLSSLSSPDKEHRRKRRRGEVANPSNTLDALVARKADDQPFEKRYLSEQEAIEGPDDEIEMKKMEMDPDVSTRTCSTCGYQGKWVSEMIRHKRVHTSERPFKCRYCSRTSKWKADLIRHVASESFLSDVCIHRLPVAETHGIRVVSKYSRSKVYDATNTSLDSPTENERIMSDKRTVTYRCQLCSFEDERVSFLNSHVNQVHNTSPCVCRCGARFEDVQGALSHSNGPCTHSEMTYNVMPTYEKGE